MSYHVLDLAERESVTVTFEAVSSLCSYYLEHAETVGFSPPLELGRDIRRQLGERDGFGVWRELMFEFEPRLRKEDLLSVTAHPGHVRTIRNRPPGTVGTLRPRAKCIGPSSYWSTLWRVPARTDGK